MQVVKRALTTIHLTKNGGQLGGGRLGSGELGHALLQPALLRTALLTITLLGGVGLWGGCTPSVTDPARTSLATTGPSGTTAAGVASPTASTDGANVSPNISPDVAPTATLIVAPGSRTVRGRFGVVTSVEANATRAAVAVLEAGGNAVDAAVALGYALAVTHPSAGNLGGGGFMLVKPVGRPAVAIDFREQAPLSVTPANFQAMLDRRGRGVGASGLPGSVAGYNLARERWGTRPLAELIAPAIKLAEAGHALGEQQALVLSWAWPELRKEPQVSAIFGRGGRPHAHGALVRQPALAQTLRRISVAGNAGFYEGPFADSLVKFTASTAWPVTADELRHYEARVREALRTKYHGLLVETAPPPSAGGAAVVTLLGLLESQHAERFPADSAQGLHLFTEAAKRAHAERRFGVPDPVTTPGYDQVALLARWRNPEVWLAPFPISEARVTPAAKLHPLYESAMRELDDTTHFSVVDEDGMIVSCTTTLSGSFGARYMVPETGVFMNNSLGAFSTAGANTLAPGRRMTSSMAPTIVTDTTGPVLVLGSPGGDTIPNTVVSVLRLLVDEHRPLDEAIDAPRIHHGFVPDAIRSERMRPLPAQLERALSLLGHQFTKPARTIGDANNLARTATGWEGYADPREGGLASCASKGVGPSPSNPRAAPAHPLHEAQAPSAAEH
jgi:gamma-glutamyltranspeptidase / glutathione hydrolase